MAREQFQTLTEPMFYTLLALLEEQCGVDVMRLVQEISHERVRIGPGTLYAMLGRFEEGGYIRLTKTEGRRRWYVISDEGRRLLQEEIERQRHMQRDAMEVMDCQK
ncbi:MAG: helix-turn-helix transcriptional regulator [Eubacteriales bacterium]|nr:helix-turn-helix transcriptional regulator [Eubacteriales bacterium]